MVRSVRSGTGREKRKLLEGEAASETDVSVYGSVSAGLGTGPGSIQGFSVVSSEGGESYGLGRLGTRASKASSIGSGGPPITLSWEGLSVFAQLKQPTFGKRTQREYHELDDGRKQILFNLTGSIKPGQLVALMGASGAGKSSLINTLTGRNMRGMEVEGSIRVNGDELGRGITAVSAYVQQDDLFVPMMTVREHLRFQALLRLPATMSRERKLRRADEVLFDLGLAKCARTRIGEAGVKRGISGGEAKRLAFASEVLTNPPLLFCDEPTTGLDSYMAESVVAVLQRLADRGKTILCTIHQPASEIYAMFNRILLLAEGRTAFLGSTPDALKFFESGGIPCPLDYNPADFFIQTLAISPGREAECRRRVAALADRFAQSEYHAAVEADVVAGDLADSTLALEDLSRKSPYKATWPVQFLALLWRSVIDSYRNWAVAGYKVVNKIILGVLLGLVYLDSGSGQLGIGNKNGALFFSLMEVSFPAVFGILNILPSEYRVMVREHHDGLYKIHAYYLAKVLSYVPVYSLDGLVFNAIAYYMVGLRPDVSAFFAALAIGVLIEQCACAFGTMLSCISPNFTVALVFAGPLLTLLQMTGGYFGNVEAIPGYLSWIQWISWFRYGFEALEINQWHGVTNITCIEETQGCLRNSGEILASFSFSEANLGLDIGALVAIAVAFYAIGYVGLWIRVHKAR